MKRALASTLLLASLLPAAWSSDSELRGALEADGDADSECPAGDCSGALSLLQVRQKPTSTVADEKAADGPELNRDGAKAPAATRDLERISMVSVPYTASQTCYGYTGGTCYFDDCSAERGAVCRAHRCVCEGSCAGPDGRCYIAKTNTLVVADVRLTNVLWPKYSLYFQGISAFGQLKVTDAYEILNLGKDRFSLSRMPGNISRFLLGSATSRSKVARIASTTGTLSVSGHGLYATDLTSEISPKDLALSVCYDRVKAALMFGSNDGRYWAAIHPLSWLVYAYRREDEMVGDAGSWKPTPALTTSQIAMLPQC